MENKFLELEQKCRNGFTKYELNLLLDENTPQIGKSGYFGDYFLITYHAKQAIVFVDDYDAKVHFMTPFYDEIFYKKHDWNADERFNNGDNAILIRDNGKYNLISKKSKGKPLSNIWFKNIEPKRIYNKELLEHFYNAVDDNNQTLQLSTSGYIIHDWRDELEKCKALTESQILHDWIEIGKLVIGGYGFEWKGGKTEIIPNDIAAKNFEKFMLNKCYSKIEWKIYNGQVALSMREYSETDLL